MPEPIVTARDTAFYVTGGTLPPNAPSYIEREADRDLHTALLAGETCYILNSRQMGKSSLCVRTRVRLQQAGVRTAFCDLTRYGGNNLTASQWYIAMLLDIGRRLDLRSEFAAYWKSNEDLPPMQRLFGAVVEVGLEAATSPIVIFFDEIDMTLSLPFSADEFFAAIRQCYVGRATEERLKRLSFCLLGTATPADLIQNTRVSPFNIGRRIALRDFTREEARPLAVGLGGGESGVMLLERALYWTGGHPYLTQRLCRTAQESGAKTTTEIDKLCTDLFLTHSAKESDDNLAFVRNRLLKSEADLSALLDLYRQMHKGKVVHDDETNPLCSILKLSGVAKVENGLLKVRNRIYAHVFDRTWVTTHRTDAEKRRQRQAFIHGLSLAGAVAGVVLVVIGTLAGIAINEKHEVQFTLKRALAGEHLAKENAGRAERASERSQKSADEATKQQNIARRQKQIADAKTHYAEHQKGIAEAEKHQADRERSQARRAAESEKTERESSAQSLYGSDMQLAGHLWSEGNIARVAELLEKHRPSVRDPKDRRGFDWRYQWTLLHSVPTFGEHNGEVSQSAVLPSGPILTLDADNHLRRWDRETQKSLPQTDSFAVSKLLSPDGKMLALIKDSTKPAIVLRDLSSGVERTLPSSQVLGNPLWLFSPNSRWLALVNADNTVTVWDTGTGALVHRIENFPSAIRGLALSPDGQTLAAITGAVEVTLGLFDLTRSSAVPQFMNGSGHRVTPTALAFSLDGAYLATGDWSGNVIVWNRATRRSEHRLKSTHQAQALQLLFAGGSKTLAMGSSDGICQIWDIAHETPVRTLPGRTMPITTLAFDPSGSELLTGDSDGVAKLWDLRAIPGERYLGGKSSTVVRVADSPDGRLLAKAGGNEVSLWETNHWQQRGALLTGEEVTAVAFSRDSRLLAVGSNDKRVTVWDVATRQVRHVYSDLATSQTSHGWGPWALAFSPNGRFLAAGDGTGNSLFSTTSRCEIKIWDLRSEKLVTTLWHEGPITTIAFSPKGNLLAGGGQNNQVKVWRVDGWKQAYSIPGPDRGTGTSQGVFSLAFDRKGSTLAIGGREGAIALVDPPSGQPHFSLDGHTGTVWGLDFTPDGKTLVSMSSDHSVRCWDLASRHETQRLAGHTTQVCCGLVTANGNAVVSGAQDGGVLVHEAVSLQEADARDHAGHPYQEEAQMRRDVVVAAQNKDWPKVLRLTDPLLTHNPDSLFLLEHHANACAELGHYRPAAADLLRIANLRGSTDDYLNCGYALLAAGDNEGYQRLCAAMTHRVATTATGQTAVFYAETCAFTPDALPDMQPVLHLAEQGLKTAGVGYRDNYGRILSRIGKYQDAIRELNAGIAADTRNDVFENWVALAISYWKIGEYAQARQSLHRAQAEYRAVAKNAGWLTRLEWQQFGWKAEGLVK